MVGVGLRCEVVQGLAEVQHLGSVVDEPVVHYQAVGLLLEAVVVEHVVAGPAVLRGSAILKCPAQQSFVGGPGLLAVGAPGHALAHPPRLAECHQVVLGRAVGMLLEEVVVEAVADLGVAARWGAVSSSALCFHGHRSSKGYPVHLHDRGRDHFQREVRPMPAESAGHHRIEFSPDSIESPHLLVGRPKLLPQAALPS